MQVLCYLTLASKVWASQFRKLKSSPEFWQSANKKNYHIENMRFSDIGVYVESSDDRATSIYLEMTRVSHNFLGNHLIQGDF